MTPLEILNNIAFGFWYPFQDYIFAIWGWVIFIVIVLGLIWLITKK